MAAKFRLTPGPSFVPAKKKEWQPKESLTQSAIVDWARWAKAKYPDLEMLYMVPNGVPLHGEQRFAVINWLKAQGLRPGMPDLALPVGRGGFLGMWIEQKVRGGKLSPLQEIWINNLRRVGHYVAVCETFEQAIAELEKYCSLEPTARNGHG